MRNWISSVFGRQRRVAGRPQSRMSRLQLERLEDRTVPSAAPATAFLQTNLVSDLPGVAQVQDPNLVNPWGISESAGSPFWISDNNSGVSTLYNVPGANNTPVSINSLVVSIPTPGNPTSASGAPTGTVFNLDLAGGGFQVSNGTKSAPAIFLFATEDGTLVGWNPGINPAGSDPAKAGTFGTLAVDNSTNPSAAAGAVYKGLAIATSTTPIVAGDPNSTALLYVANFRSGQVEVYDSAFHRVALPAGAFGDPNLPSGYAPFNVQVLNGQLYVSYAKQSADKHDSVAGHGRGFVDVFNLDGSPGLANGTERLVSRGPLDSPWGLVIAPSSFGSLSGALLVGNFGNGNINAFNATTGDFLGTLTDPDGEPIQIDGLWALKVGNGKAGGAADTVYFTAGLDHESHGLFGSLGAVAPGSPEGLSEQQKVTAALDVFQIDLTTLQKDLSSGASRPQLQQDIQNLNTALVDLVRAEIVFATDAIRDAGPGAHDRDSGSHRHDSD